MKTREEIIKKAQELLACGALSKEACDAIKADFPELAESEDEKVWQWIREHINHDGTNMFDKAVDWLTKQKEQKPVEWSEKDERIRQRLIKDLENAETDDEDVQKELNEDVAWLKSLCPSWKPSQEQPEVDSEKVYDAYCKVCGHYAHTTPAYICRQACDYFKDFKASLNARKEDEK